VQIAQRRQPFPCIQDYRAGENIAPTVKDSYSPSFHVLFYFGSLSLDSVDGLILLLNQDTHLSF
jgi:hypothetical protein